MSVKQQTTVYRCDGCGYEMASPYNWRTFAMLGSGIMSTGGLHSSSEDYCESCVQKMRSVVRQQTEAPQTPRFVTGDDPNRPVTT